MKRKGEEEGEGQQQAAAGAHPPVHRPLLRPLGYSWKKLRIAIRDTGSISLGGRPAQAWEVGYGLYGLELQGATSPDDDDDEDNAGGEAGGVAGGKLKGGRGNQKSNGMA